MNELFRIIFGDQGGFEQFETLTPQQRDLFSQLQQALMGGDTSSPIGGAIGRLGALAGGDPQAMQEFEQPMMNQFNQETVPGLAARFGGMGSGGALSGTGFRQAALREGSNLQDRIAATRAGLQTQAAGQLPAFYGQAGQQQFQPAYRQPRLGLLGSAAQGLGDALGQGASKMGGGF